VAQEMFVIKSDSSSESTKVMSIH